MKKEVVAIATALTLVSGVAIADQNSSFSDGDGFVRMMQKMASDIDHKPTSAVDGMMMEGKQVFQTTMFINGRDARVRYTVTDGVKEIIGVSYLSSDR